MPSVNNVAVLKITRGLILAIMGLVVFAGVVLALVAVVLPLNWDAAVAEILREKPGVQTQGLLPLLYVIFAFGIVLLGIAWTIMKKLLAMIATVAGGDPFVHANALRLKAIGWMMVAVQLLGIPLYLVAAQVAAKFGDHDLDGDFSVTGLLAILLVFVLAGVFEQGAAMREEMEGTV